MARAAYEIDSRRRAAPAAGECATPVIADDGERAWVAVVRLGRPPAVGDRFTFRGRTWEVARDRDFVRGFVARPVAPQPCAH